MKERKAVLAADILGFFGTLAQFLGLAAMVERCRPDCQCPAEIESVTLPASVLMLWRR